VTIDEVSGGRFTMGIGTGWLDEEFELFGLPYPSRGARFEMLTEAMGYLHAALAPRPHGFHGEHFHLAEFEPRPHPINLRLLVGGGGSERTPRLAGRYADEYNIYACPPDQFEAKRELARATAIESGRDPDALLISTAAPAIAAKSESDYRRLLHILAERTRSTPERITEVYQARGYPHGSGSKPAEMLLALEEVGCRRFYPQMFLGNPADYDLILDAYGH
jgi:alkanesulfonate monooxygenase SsuD/methylene tetrahydromethanopterin reductase-like flavin-dependent oxidoreductase (luciferase family)